MKRVESPQEIFTLESFGGTGGFVTGSSHRLNIKNSSVMIDLGMFQGRTEERSKRGERRNFEPLKENSKDVTEILISHVHIDHSGRIPVIYKNGFTPRILATPETAAYLVPMLENSAQIQESEHPQNRLYEPEDVEKTLRYIRSIEPFTELPIGQKHSKITAEFLLNGHVMGSSSIFVRNPNNHQNILFTGDMGKPMQSLCGGYKEYDSFYPQDPVHILVAESTSFTKDPVSFEEKRKKFFASIKETWACGGTPLFAALAFHRTPEIIEMLSNGQKTGEIPSDCQIFIDAPLAMKLLDTLKDLGPEYLSKRYGDDPNYYKNDQSSIERFDLQNVHIIESHLQSILCDQTMANYTGKAIIIASGGMCEHGRSVNYIKGNFGKNPNNTIIMTCYQVEGTNGSDILRRTKVLNGKKDGAKVIQINGFTSHISGPVETFEFFERFDLSKLSKVIITHGKDQAREAMAAEFVRRNYKAEILLSKPHQVIKL